MANGDSIDFFHIKYLNYCQTAMRIYGNHFK